MKTLRIECPEVPTLADGGWPAVNIVEMKRNEPAGHAEMLEGAPRASVRQALRNPGRARPFLRRRPMTGNICVLAEQWRGQISEVDLRSAGAGPGSRRPARRAAHRDPDRLQLPGNWPRSWARRIPWSISTTRCSLKSFRRPAREAVAQVLEGARPRALLVPLTNISLGIGTHDRHPLSVPVINFCNDLKVAGGRLEAHCVMYGGKIEVMVEAGASTGPSRRSWECGRARGRRTRAVSERAVPVTDAAVVLRGYPGHPPDADTSNPKPATWT